MQIKFRNRNGTENKDCCRSYNIIKTYAQNNNLDCTLRSLDLASNLHAGTYRDGNGAPYVIHPLDICHYLVILDVQHAIYTMNISILHDESLARRQSIVDLDKLLSVALLHDTLEDCKQKLSGGGNEFIARYGLYPEILDYITILTKDKSAAGYTIEGYFDKICNNWITMLVKIVDRINNCSTIYAFSDKRMEKYVRETVTFFYPMCSKMKAMYPELSRITTICKYFLVSVCETAAAALNLSDVINANPKKYEKTFIFIKGFAVGNGNHQNTLKALPLAKKYYAGIKRKTGDPFIIPLRVASYLISLKIDDDIIISAALLHEIIKKAHIMYNGLEIVTQYHLDPRILDYVRLLSNSENYPTDVYYDTIKQIPDVLLLKLSIRANTCTNLNSDDLEIKQYVAECEKFIYPLCEYGIKHYPQYSYSIEIIYYHISSICNIVKNI